MKKYFSYASSLVLLWTFMMAAGCDALDRQKLSTIHQAEGQAGMTFQSYKTAAGFRKHITEYDWTLEKKVLQNNISEIPNGSSGQVAYELAVTKNIVSEKDVLGVEGEVCITNGGAVATENLTVTDIIQYKTGSGQFQNLVSNPVDLSTKPVLLPGETYCYPYSFEFEPVDGAIYRNEADITITNHSGYLGTPFGPNPKADFSIPQAAEMVYIDGEATLEDVLVCPAGFECLADNSGPWSLTDSASVFVTVTVTNVSSMCDSFFDLVNNATLTESTNGQQHTASATVQLYTGACPTGCTLTIGYWKTHAGFGPQPDSLSALLPVQLGITVPKGILVDNAALAVDLLAMKTYGDPSNGITKLYAQLLGAKLNILNGADSSAVASVIQAVDQFLGSYDYTAWGTLTKAKKLLVLSWQTALDNYNNGLIGPGHCD
jgi:hypothetical protein